MKMILVVNLLFLFSFSHSIRAKSIIVGKTYPIIEISPTEYVKRKSKEVNWPKFLENRTSSFIETMQHPLPFVKEASMRLHVPWAVLEKAIHDKDGRTVYPEGFKYNPLNYLNISYRIIVAHEDQLKKLLSKLKPNDLIILSQGNPIKAREITNMPVYLLDLKSKRRLNVKAVPSIISQVGNLLEIKEVNLDEENE